ncbi:MAG: vWA domain-containing protein [Candidatus Thorarchaeota archaeon]
MSSGITPSSKLKALAIEIQEHVQPLRSLPNPHGETYSKFVKKASKVGMSALVKTSGPDQFLQYLDDLLDANVELDVGEVLREGRSKGIPDAEIFERFDGSFEILKALVETNEDNMYRYSHLMQKIGMSGPMLNMDKGITKPKRSYPGDYEEDFKELMQSAVDVKNSEAMAALGHADLKTAMDTAQGMSAEALDSLVGSMSRGPGENLLLQWFYHRKSLPKEIKQKVRELAKKALIEVAMNWPSGRLGSGEKGLAPSIKKRPFRDGDDIDQIDVESTIESVVLSGKTLEMITTDDLVVWDTERGRVAACFLLDISGSMSGEKLAMCAISVVMLVGNLKPEEIAVSLFESNTHVIKGFEEEKDLDEVADELLDISARGGTCAERAFRWSADQMTHSAEAEQKLVMIFTDAVTESTNVLRPQLERLANLKVRFIVGLNARYSRRDNADDWADLTDGEVMVLNSIHEIPKMLSDVLNNLK